jgi:hypothetical protein
MAEQWIIRVQGKDYGPADLQTLKEWKADGRVIPTNPARRADVDSENPGSVHESLWRTASEIPGLFRADSSTAKVQARDQRPQIADQRVESKRPSRNVLVETFRIYLRGFFQFLGLSLLSIVPILCAEFTSRFIGTAPGVNVDLRTLIAGALAMCMFVLRLVLIPVYVAGIQILAAELVAGNRLGFFDLLNGAVKYWPRVAGTGLFVLVVFFLLFVFALVIAIMVLISSTLSSIVIALGLLAVQVWLFARFFVYVLFWQQFAVLQNLNGTDSLRESNRLARSGSDLQWFRRPLWRGAFIVSLWYALLIALGLAVLWPRLVAEWPVVQDYFNQLTQTQDPQAVLQKINASLQTSRGFDYRDLILDVAERILQPLLGIAFVVLYLDCKRER